MKKLAGTLLALVLVLALMVAVAEPLAAAPGKVPSKSTKDTTKVVAVESEDGVELGADFGLGIVEDTPEVAQEIANLYQFVAEQGKPPVQYFPQETQQAIAEALPEVDLDTLDLNEFVTMSETGYDENYGGILETCEFLTKYDPQQKVAALVGYYFGGVAEWHVSAAEVLPNGNVKIHFTKDDMLRMEKADTVALAIISTPV